MSADERLVAVLAEHEEGDGWQADESNHLVYDCACGEVSPPLATIEDGADSHAAADWHRAHVAAVLRGAGYIHRDEVDGAREAVVIAIRRAAYDVRRCDQSRNEARADAALAAVTEHLDGGSDE